MSTVNLTDLPFVEKFPSAIDNTMRTSFTSCPRKFYYAHILALQPKTPSIHLHAGAAFAKSLEVTRREFYELRKPADEAELLGAQALRDAYGTFDVENGYEEHAKSLTNMLRAFQDYFMEYPLNSDTIVPVITPEGKAAVEFSFSIPLDTEPLHPTSGDPLLYCGKFDMLGLRDGVIFVVDEKTTGSLGETWRKQWDLNPQFTGYCYAAKTFGYPVAGAIIRGVGLLKTRISHEQAIVYRPDHLIEKWRAQLSRDVSRMVAAWDTGLWDFAFNNACTDYGGCSYKSLCQSPDPERWMTINFVERRWDPLAARD